MNLLTKPIPMIHGFKLYQFVASCSEQFLIIVFDVDPNLQLLWELSRPAPFIFLFYLTIFLTKQKHKGPSPMFLFSYFCISCYYIKDTYYKGNEHMQ